MKCVDAQKLIRPYLDNTLPDKEMIPFLEHVNHCPDCHEDLEIYMALYGVLDKEEETEYHNENFARAVEEKLLSSKDDLEKRSMHSSLSWTLVILAETVLLCALILGIRPHIEQQRTMDRFDFSYKAMRLQEAESEEALSEKITELPGDEIMEEPAT